MHEVFTPLEAQTVQEDRENLEVVVLLVTNNVNHLVDRVVVETHLCRTNILCHINRCAVLTQQEFLI